MPTIIASHTSAIDLTWAALAAAAATAPALSEALLPGILIGVAEVAIVIVCEPKVITEADSKLLLGVGDGVGDGAGAGVGVGDEEEDENGAAKEEVDDVGAGAGAAGDGVLALGGEPTRGTAGDPLSVDVTALSIAPPTKTAGRSNPASRH